MPLAHLAPSSLFPTSWRLLRRLPHDPAAFTQGLAFYGRLVVESTGLYGASSLRVVSLTPDRYAVERAVSLQPSEFGEGVALWPPAAPRHAIQLLWSGSAALRWRLPALQPAAPLRVDTGTGEGWGLAPVCRGALALSDGSHVLSFVAPTPDGALARVAPPLAVTLPSGAPLAGLNALCGAHGWVLANVWGSPCVAVVRPQGSGVVASLLDFSVLAAENQGAEDDVLNGLAYRGAANAGAWGGVLLLTGKRWQFMYEVSLGGLREST